MADPRDIVERFVGAFYGGDAPTARRYLADDLSFVGPGATFSAADDFLRASAHVAPGVRAVERRKVFVDGQDVCVVHDLVLNHRAGTGEDAGGWTFVSSPVNVAVVGKQMAACWQWRQRTSGRVPERRQRAGAADWFGRSLMRPRAVSLVVQC